MTETQIERQVESRTNALDRRFTAGSITQAEYDAGMQKIDDWAAEQFRRTHLGREG